MGMTNAERQAKYRARHRQELERLRAAAGSAPAAKAAPGSKPAPDYLAENMRLTFEVRRLKAELATDKDAEIARLKAKIAKLEAKPKTPKTPRAPPSENEQIESLKKQLRKVRALNRYLANAHPNVMTPATFRTIVKALHPDGQPTWKEKNDACAMFTGWNAAVEKLAQ